MTAILNRRGGKYDSTPAKVKPDYEIRDFDALIRILEKDFGVRIP
jgi:hypothetical protein